MADDILTNRDLNRALLARQMLLERQTLTPVEALARLFAIQGQLPRTPFIGLWARLAGFKPEALRKAIADREVVRATTLRGALHLMTAADFLAFRALFGPGEDLSLPGGMKTTQSELAPILAAAREHFAKPHAFETLREALEAAGHSDVRTIAHASRVILPLVQVAADGPHGFSPGGEFVLAEAYLGQEIAANPAPADLLRRYLSAWGPATPGDFRGWSGLKAVAPLFEELGDELVTLRDERKRTLFDLRTGPRPGGDTPAPPRLVPDFDAVILGNQDKGRILPAEHAPKIASRNLQIPPLLLVNGFVAGTWKLEAKRNTATVTVTAFAKLSAKDLKAVEAEAIELARTFEPNAAPAVVFV